MNAIKQTKDNETNRRSIGKACLASCQKLLARIEQAKEAILAEFRGTLAVHAHLVRLAVNEAEALAWQTDFPHLVFPTLAAEKVRAVADWQARQQSKPRAESRFAHIN